MSAYGEWWQTLIALAPWATVVVVLAVNFALPRRAPEVRPLAEDAELRDRNQAMRNRIQAGR